jgi:TetR/AcrR family tetracycline transcriptional repressor
MDRQIILDKALELLDKNGLEGLSMRKLAQELGVQAPALYWHFPNKIALLDEMAETLIEGVADRIDPARDHLEVLRQLAVETRRGLLSRRDGARVLAGTFVARRNTLRLSDMVIGVLLRSGFDARTAARVIFSLGYFIMGFVIEEQALAEQTRDNDGLHPFTEKFWEQPAGGYEDVRAILPELVEVDQDARFAFGVDLFLKGLAATREASVRGTA